MESDASSMATKVEDDQSCESKSLSTPKEENVGTATVVLVEAGDQWSTGKRWYFSALSSSLIFNATLSSSLTSVLPLEQIFHTSHIARTLSTSLFVLGFALGPVFWAPYGEMVGRRLSLSIAFGLFTLFNFLTVFSPTSSIAYLLIFRCLGGCMAACAMTNAATVNSDIWTPAKRGGPIALFCVTGIWGQSLGPFIGGLIQSNPSVSWRLYFGVITVSSFISFVLVVMTLPETYAPLLTGQIAAPTSFGTKLQTFVTVGLGRPLRLLVTEPICCLVSIYIAVVYGIAFLTLKAWPIAFQQHYHLSPVYAGTSFTFIGLGAALGGILALWFDRRYQAFVRSGVSIPKPEDRAEVGYLGGPLIAISLFWFGWTVNPSIPPIVPMLAGVPMGAGIILIYVAFQAYLVDSYTLYAASAMGANTILRSIFGFAFPLFTDQMFASLEVRGSASLLAGLAILMSPIPFFFRIYGSKLRARSPFASGFRDA